MTNWKDLLVNFLDFFQIEELISLLHVSSANKYRKWNTSRRRDFIVVSEILHPQLCRGALIEVTLPLGRVFVSCICEGAPLKFDQSLSSVVRKRFNDLTTDKYYLNTYFFFYSSVKIWLIVNLVISPHSYNTWFFDFVYFIIFINTP